VPALIVEFDAMFIESLNQAFKLNQPARGLAPHPPAFLVWPAAPKPKKRKKESR